MLAMARKRNLIWAAAAPRPAAVGMSERLRIKARCDDFIATVLKPTLLPEVTPTQFNYPVDIRGDWRAGRYRFLARYRSGHDDNAGEEFDRPFARLDHMGPDRFDFYWMRHTGTWWPLDSGLLLEDALDAVVKNRFLYPL
jgi:hypothetical protein